MKQIVKVYVDASQKSALTKNSNTFVYSADENELHIRLFRLDMALYGVNKNYSFSKGLQNFNTPNENQTS